MIPILIFLSTMISTEPFEEMDEQEQNERGACSKEFHWPFDHETEYQYEQEYDYERDCNPGFDQD